MKKLPAATVIAIVADFRKQSEDLLDWYEASLKALLVDGQLENPERARNLDRGFLEAAKAIRERARAALDAASIDTTDDRVH